MKPVVKPLHIKFSGPPPIGSIISIKEREFELVDVQPHVRRDGGNSNVLTWIASCLDCGCDFEQTTGRSFSTFRRRCEECRVVFVKERDRKNGDA